MQIVLLSGKAGSGKSTLQALLLAEYGRAKFTGAQVLNFADPLYRLQDVLLNQFEIESGKKRVKKDRRLLQVLGTEWARHEHGADIWVELLRSKTDLIYMWDHKNHENTLVIVGDCRFKNEFDLFPSALRVRLQAVTAERKERADKWPENENHPSEIDLDDYHTSGKFDLYLDTSAGGTSPEGCCELVLAKLLKNSWKEKR